MAKSILGLPHILLAILTLVSYMLLAMTILYQRVTAKKQKMRIRVLALSGMIGIFLLVDTGFYMFRVENIFTHQLHHPIALAAMFGGSGGKHFSHSHQTQRKVAAVGTLFVNHDHRALHSYLPPFLR